MPKKGGEHPRHTQDKVASTSSELDAELNEMSQISCSDETLFSRDYDRNEIVEFDYELTTGDGADLFDAVTRVEAKMLRYTADVLMDCDSRSNDPQEAVDGIFVNSLDSFPMDYVDKSNEHCHSKNMRQNTSCTPVKGAMTARVCASCSSPFVKILQTVREGALNDLFLSGDNHTVLGVEFLGIRENNDFTPKSDLVPNIPDQLQHLSMKDDGSLTPLGGSMVFALCSISVVLGIGFGKRRMKTEKKSELESHHNRDVKDSPNSANVNVDETNEEIFYKSQILSFDRENDSLSSQYGMEVVLY